MVRKYAFHMILAGHRFSKAGQVSIFPLRGYCSWKDGAFAAFSEDLSWDPSTHAE